ncbi:MAG TPA: hypothetical protein VHF50_01825 [Solirubrobacterales bacterium]|nr:hypothetical protein [Solirubrobacterales bacterium]
MRVLARSRSERRVVLVDPDRHAELGPRPLGEADVVEVRMGEQNGAHLVEPPPDRADRLGQG